MQLNKKLILSAALSTIALAGLAMGQGRMKSGPNEKSPISKTEMPVGDKKILIEYNAPSLRGRQVIGGSVVPYGQVWRTGADAATTLTTPVDITIGTLKVPAGVYSLYTLPDKSSWKLIVSKQVGQWGTEYS